MPTLTQADKANVNLSNEHIGSTVFRRPSGPYGVIINVAARTCSVLWLGNNDVESGVTTRVFYFANFDN